MKNQSQRETKKVQWKEMARVWAGYLPPSKPSRDDMKFYENYLKEYVKKSGTGIKALVLGATPEFRDLLSKHKINTTFVDINPDMVMAMTSLLKLSKNRKEKFVLSDWMHMPFKKNSFDIILSDSAQDNIKYSEFNAFFRSMHEILKPNGYWFFGAVNVNNDNQITFQQYVDLYKKTPTFFKDQRNYWLSLFRLCYSDDFYNKKTKTYNFRKVDEKINVLIKKNLLSKEAMKDIGLGMDYQQVVISENNFKNLTGKYFEIIDEFRDKSHPAMAIKWTAVLRSKK